MITVKL